MKDNLFLLETKVIKIYKWLISIFLYYSGFIKIYNHIRAVLGFSRVVILANHDISNNPSNFLELSMWPVFFKKQIYFLKNHYEIITLEEASEIIFKNIPLSGDKIVLTFDDNYKAYYTLVYPSLKALSLKATFFICPESIEKGLPLFTDALIYAVSKADIEVLDLSSYGLSEYPIATDREKTEAIQLVNEESKKFSPKKKKELINDIFIRLNVDGADLKNSILSWDNINKMIEGGMDIGSHTLHHSALAMLQISEAKKEILLSKQIIEKKTGMFVKFFAYPFGDKESYSPELANYIKEVGFQGACSLAYKSSEKDPYRLPRINMDNPRISMFGKFSKPLLAMELSGLSFFLFFRWLKK